MTEVDMTPINSTKRAFSTVVLMQSLIPIRLARLSRILTIPLQGVKAKQSLRRDQPFGLQIGDNHSARRLKLSTIIAIAWPRERAQPLLGMGLEHGGARTHELTAFASEIARRTHPAQATAWLRKRKCSDEGTLTGSLACTVNIEDE